MLESALFQLFILSLIINIALTIISFVLTIVIHKENHISAAH